MKYTQIVFDVDGTLIDTEYAVLHSLQDTILEVTGKKVGLEELTFSLGITGSDGLTQLGVEDVTTALSIWEQKIALYKDYSKVFDTVVKLLNELTAKGCKLGIVTSKTRNEFANDFSVFGIDDYFSTIVCADDTNEHKPNAEPLLKYMELAKCRKEEVLYVGDSIYDMKCAMNANVDFALAGWGAKNRVDAPVICNTPLDIVNKLI